MRGRENNVDMLPNVAGLDNTIICEGLVIMNMKNQLWSPNLHTDNCD